MSYRGVPRGLLGDGTTIFRRARVPYMCKTASARCGCFARCCALVGAEVAPRCGAGLGGAPTPTRSAVAGLNVHSFLDLHHCVVWADLTDIKRYFPRYAHRVDGRIRLEGWSFHPIDVIAKPTRAEFHYPVDRADDGRRNGEDLIPFRILFAAGAALSV